MLKPCYPYAFLAVLFVGPTFAQDLPALPGFEGGNVFEGSLIPVGGEEVTTAPYKKNILFTSPSILFLASGPATGFMQVLVTNGPPLASQAVTPGGIFNLNAANFPEIYLFSYTFLNQLPQAPGGALVSFNAANMPPPGTVFSIQGLISDASLPAGYSFTQATEVCVQ